MTYAEIPVGSYFLTAPHTTAARLPVPCLKAREECGRIRCTRLTDGAFIDGLAESPEFGPVSICTRADALVAAAALRAAYA